LEIFNQIKDKFAWKIKKLKCFNQFIPGHLLSETASYSINSFTAEEEQEKDTITTTTSTIRTFIPVKNSNFGYKLHIIFYK